MHIILTIFILLVLFIIYLLFKFVYYPKFWVLQQKKKYGKEIEIVHHFGAAMHTEFRKNYLEDGDSCSFIRKLHKKNPDVKALAFNFASEVGISFLDPELIKQVHQNPDKFMKIDQYPVISFLFNDSLLFQNGKKWQNQRAFLGKLFHFTSIKNHYPNVKETCEEVFGKISKQLISNEQKEIQVVKICEKVTSEVVFKVFFGMSQGKFDIKKPDGSITTVANEVVQIVTDSYRLIQTDKLVLIKTILFRKNSYFILPTKGEKQILDRMIALKEACNKVIQDRKQQLLKNPTLSSNNFLDNFLSEMILNKNEYITNENIIDSFLGLYFGGTDTTGNLAGVALYYLSQYPEIQKQAREEIINAITIKSKSTDPNELFKSLEFEDLNNLNLLNSIVKESLRLSPPAAGVFVRKAVQNIKIGNFQLNKGDLVQTQFLHNQSNPSVFPNPEQFNPSRWMNSQEKQDVFNFTPFSLGPRNCIGQHLAMIEAKSILAYVLLNFDIIPNNSQKLKLEVKIIYGPSPDNLVYFRKRQNI